MCKGSVIRQHLSSDKILPILGVINAYAALLAENAGAKCIYLSGAGVANACYGLPDLALTAMEEVLQEARKIVQISSLPLLVDIDTGFGSVLNVARTIKLMEAAGVAAVHIEDQVFEKRCGHLKDKRLVSAKVMGDRIKAAVDARHHADFMIMARTDALASEPLSQVVDRLCYYTELGADLVFLEAITDPQELQSVVMRVQRPILVNATEFGKTPLYSQQQWQDYGAKMILYPLTAFRAMSKMAQHVYQTILNTGSQESLLPNLQTRQELYSVLNYEYYENLLAGEKHA